MTIRSIVRTTVAAVSAVMITTGSMQIAAADEADQGLTASELRDAAVEAGGPEAGDAVDNMLSSGSSGSSSSAADDVDPSTLTANWGDSSEKRKFWTPGLSVGCGVGDLPVTGSFATLQGGPNYGAGPLLGKSNLIQPYIPTGHTFFHVFTLDEKLAPIVKGTDVTVAWFNLRTGRGGIEKLDDTVLGAGINAQTSKLVYTGTGPVVATITGKVAYNGDESCTLLPIVGSTTVN